MSSNERQTVVIAGAAGFVGSPLVDRLKGDLNVIALSRRERPSAPGVEWRACDLLSSREAADALEGADLAIYLVHSMLPSDRLVQGSFEDFDLQAADNFARACAAHGVKQIVYLGGLLPRDLPVERLSRHLKSRAEVESALAARGVPVTVLRAGLVLGPGGSSTQIMVRLSKRLPVMVCPSWTDTPTQPIALDDALDLIRWVLGRDECLGKTFDIGGPEVVTYRKLMQTAGELLGRTPMTIPVPFITPALSRLWITLVTGAPKALVAPLVESLTHRMVAADRRLQDLCEIPGRPISETLAEAIRCDTGDSPRAFRAAATDGPPLVRSVQRMVGIRLNPHEAAAEYLSWLSAKLSPVIRVTGDAAAHWQIRVASPTGPVLLSFSIDTSTSSSDRAVYDIDGGLLAAAGGRGRFEFRSVLGGEVLLCSIHHFVPSLPWRLYVLTQAKLHLLVMTAFGRHLRQSFSLRTVPAPPQLESRDKP